jgi:hypothetical protein
MCHCALSYQGNLRFVDGTDEWHSMFPESPLCQAVSLVLQMSAQVLATSFLLPGQSGLGPGLWRSSGCRPTLLSMH